MASVTVEQPTAPRERIFALDVLRGIAMFGVLIAYCMWSLGSLPEENWSTLDHALAGFAGFAVDGKFYTLLAFLFGLGFSMQLGRASNDSSAVELYSRRLTMLAAIGLVHALLLRNGDILLPYALAGFLLIPLRRSSDGMLIAVMLVAMLAPYAARLLWPVLGFAMPTRPQLEDAADLTENAAWVGYWYRTAILTWPTNFALLVLGFLAGRHQLISTAGRWPAWTLGLVAIASFIAAAGLYFARRGLLQADPITPFLQAFAGLLFTLHGLAMAGAYASALLVALRSRAGRTAFAPVAAIGRLALTNYLMQAALIVPVCLAFGLFDRFTPTDSLLLAVAVFGAVQIPFSWMWLRRFQFGPAEWMWRSVTYGRVPALSEKTNSAPV